MKTQKNPRKRKEPPQSDLRSSSSPYCSTSLARGAMQNPISPTCGRPAPPTRLALCSCRQGEREISRYKRKTRVYRMNVCRGGPCVRPQPSRMSGNSSLLSKGLRGGKSRRLKVESLLRHMLQSAQSKSAMKRSLSKKSIVGGKAPTPQGFNRGPAAARWCNVCRNRFHVG